MREKNKKEAKERMQKEKVLISIHPEDSFSPEEEVIIATEKVAKFLTEQRKSIISKLIVSLKVFIRN